MDIHFPPKDTGDAGELGPLLAKHGWTDVRRFPMKSSLADIEKQGFTVTPTAARFLEANQGIGGKIRERYLSFGWDENWVDIGEDEMCYFASLIGEPLVPVGIFQGSSIILISESGKFVTLHDQWSSYHVHSTLEDLILYISRESWPHSFLWPIPLDKKPPHYRN